MAIAKNPCSGKDCANLVAERRPSSSGTHWCPRPECQAEKQRYFRARRTQKVEGHVLEQAAEFVATLVGTERMHCGVCGYAAAIPGYAHPDPRPDYAGHPCFHLGSKGAGIGKLLGAAYGVARPAPKVTASGINLADLRPDKDHE